jgi:hypothetical protein
LKDPGGISVPPGFFLPSFLRYFMQTIGFEQSEPLQL